MIATAVAWIASFFAKEAVGKFLAALWNVLTNPIGAALIAATLSGFYFTQRQDRIVRNEWSAANAVATAQNERDRLARDALMKAKMEANAKERTATLEARNTILEKKAQDYDDYVAKHPAGAWTITPADERGMQIAPYAGKPKPVRGRTNGLFGPFGKS